MLTWIELSKQHIQSNLDLLRSKLGDAVLMAPAIKANAYGHGLLEMAHELVEHGVDWLSVYSITDAVTLRETGITIPIVVMGYVEMEELKKTIDLDLILFVYDLERINVLDDLAKVQNTQAKIFIKFDSGMTRHGLVADDVKRYVKELKEFSNIAIEGIATHFATSDLGADDEHFELQLERTKLLLKEFEEEGITIKHVSAAKSSVILLHAQAHFDVARPGIAIYGLYPSDEVRREIEKGGEALKPVLSFKTRVVQIKAVGKGVKVGYSCSFETQRDSIIAILPVGYYDGIDRRLGNTGHVLIAGKRAPIIGRVCMNISIVDVTDIDSVQVYDEVVIIGRQGGEEIMVDEIAS